MDTLLADWTVGLRSLTLAGGPCRDPLGVAAVLRRAVNLRRFVWSVAGGRPAAEDLGAALWAAATLRLEALDLSLVGCGLGPDALDRAVCAPLGALRRAGYPERLSVDVNGNRVGSAGVDRLARAVAGGPAAADRLYAVRFSVWDVDAADDRSEAAVLGACGPLAGLAGRLRTLYLDVLSAEGTPRCGVRDGLVPLLRALRPALRDLTLRLGLRCDRRSAVRELFAAIGACPELRRCDVDLLRCGLADRHVAGGVLAPLVGGCPRLADLSLSIGGAEIGPAAAGRLAALAPRLRSLALRGGVPTDPGVWDVLRAAAGVHRWEFFAQGLTPDVAPVHFPARALPLPPSLGVLRLEISESPGLAASGFVRRLADGLAGAVGLSDVQLSLRAAGLTAGHWERLCAGVGGLPRLVRLHLDVRRNRVADGAEGFAALGGAHRLTHLRVLLDGNPLSVWSVEGAEALLGLPIGLPRLCEYKLSLRDCSLPYGLSLRIVDAQRTLPASLRALYSF